MEIKAEKQQKQQQNIRGIKIKNFNLFMMAVTLVIYVILISFTIGIYKNYNATQDSTRNFIHCRQMVAQLWLGSDYLTEQVRLFAETGDLQYAEAYFEEATVTKRRDNALEQFMELNDDPNLDNEFAEALKLSNELMEIEYRSMRLTAEAYDIDPASLPDVLKQFTLSAEDSSLSREQKEQKGRLLVFDDTYREYKENIYGHLNIVTDSILSRTENRMNEDNATLRKTLSAQRVMITLLFIMNFIMFFFIISMVIRPLSIYVRNIQDYTLFDIVGSYEFKYLALTYNNIYEVNAANQEILQYSSEHDKLTGAFNRTAFDSITQRLKKTTIPLALLVIDIDHFKSINDTYGHGTGDAVLRKVAQVITRNFRSDDKVIRYGGDEFVIIMTETTSEKRQVISAKIDDINNTLTHPNDGLPAVSLSVGIVFSENGYHDDLFKKADEALYQVKNGDRCGYKFAE